MKWLRNKMSTLFSRTLFGMLAVSLTVLIITAGSLFVWFRTEMVRGYYELIHAAMGNTDAVFSGNISDARQLLLDWYGSADGVSLRLDENTDFLEHMSFVNRVLDNLRGSSFIQSVCFVNREREMALSMGSNLSYPENLDGILVEKLEEENSRNSPFVWKVKNYQSDQEMISLLTIPMAETRIGDDNFMGMAVINIDLAWLNKGLFSDQQDGQFRLLVLNGDGMVVGNSSQENLGENWSDREWVRRVMNGEEQFEIRENGKRWEILASPAQYEGFWIVAQSDYVTQIMNINSVFYMISAIILLAAGVIILLMFLVARRIFRPFHKVVGNLKQSEIGEKMNPEQDDVAFLEHFYRDVSTQMRAMNDKKEKDFIVKNLLLGTQSREIQVLLQQRGILSAGKPYYMVLLSLENEDRENSLSMQEYDMLRGMVSSVFSTALEQEGRCTCFEVGLRRILFLISQEAGREERILETMRKAEGSAGKLASVRLFSVLSGCLLDEGESCTRSFRRMNDYLKTRQLLGCAQTFLLPEKEESGQAEETERIVEYLKQKDKEGYMEAVNRMLIFCEKLPWEAFMAQLELVVRSVSRAGKIVKYSEGSGRKAEGNSIREHIAALFGREELLLWLESLYDEAALQISRVAGHSTAALMEEAVDYIRSNYDDSSLSVNLLADRLNISSAYFGKLFTEFTGTRMLDYVLKVRMEKARELLLAEPGCDIAHIAERVGYNNSTYFTTAFKKYYGVTPSRFREYHVAERMREEEEAGEKNEKGKKEGERK